MDLLKAIRERRAVRDFSDVSVTRERVREIIHLAAEAPSTMNLQPWAFAVFHGRERLARYSRRAKAHLLATMDPTFGLDPRIDQYVNVEANLFHGADTLVVICARPGRFSPVEDCFLAAQTFMLAAHGLGLGSCPVGFARSWFNRAEVKAELGIPQPYEAVLPIALGYAASRPLPVSRNEPEIVCWHWDE